MNQKHSFIVTADLEDKNKKSLEFYVAVLCMDVMRVLANNSLVISALTYEDSYNKVKDVIHPLIKYYQIKNNLILCAEVDSDIDFAVILGIDQS